MRCPCGCKVELLPLGTLVLTKDGQAAEVGGWCQQDHWNVPLRPLWASKDIGLIVARRTLRVRMLGSDPLLGPHREPGDIL
jgi:hypothetical protein